MLWFALHLRALPLEGWLPAPGAAPPAAPSNADGGVSAMQVVIQDRLVVAVAADALACGVQVGMNLAAATALAPELQVWPRNLAAEAALVERLALALSRYTPSLVVQPDGVLLEVAASVRLFGGARKLALAVAQTARDCGLQAIAFAAAPTASAATVLARVEQDPTVQAHSKKPTHPRRTTNVQKRLDALPLAPVLAVWQQPSALAQLLHGIGCRTLGHVRELPRTGLKRRGGQALMDAVERAYGDAPDPQTWYELPPHFEKSLELLHRADDAATLVFAAQRLVQPLVGWLAQRWLATTRLSLGMKHQTLHRRVQPDTVLTLTLGEPSRDADQIMLLLREQLQRLALPAPVYAITLRVDESVPHAGRSGSFWRSQSTQREGERDLIDRLSARLGPKCVQRVQLHADHRPEHALQWVTAQHNPPRCPPSHLPPQQAPPHPATTPAHQVTPHRPTWLLHTPQPLQEHNNRPTHEGEPLTLLSRAERIEAGWFDGALASRDYHVAVGPDQRCLWVYRERCANPRWFLHGIFG